ncbi:hypothetical protein [Pseudomonas paeninsulae]|uniref:hypothetical protein n=1 Tax=Pseudomonas paeninsulae TaxID=3110772 RepID=UPI002D790C54|nr:hypothetical protein [Pseudomonas sp. IT1137]
MINRFFASLLVAAVVGALGVAASYAAESSHLLDGKTFVGKNGEKGHPLATVEGEALIFADGLFTSGSCEPYNFGSSEYSTKVEGSRIYFEVVTISPSHGQIAWQGVVDGDVAQATFVWTKERWYWDTRREYWFKGTLKQ